MLAMTDNEYMRIYMATRRAQRRQRLIDEFGAQCQECGSSSDLEFDHRDPSTKKFNLSGCYLDKAWHLVMEEARKCDLLCHWCHLGKSGLHNNYIGGWNKIENPEHGTPHMYHAYGCRCTHCKFAKVMYRAKDIGYLDVVQAPPSWRRGRVTVPGSSDGR